MLGAQMLSRIDNNKISNEFVEDCVMRFNNSQKKKEGKLSKLKDSDILIYDVEMKQFFKKINNVEESKITKNLKENSVMSGMENVNHDEESLVKVKVKRFPVNIIQTQVQVQIQIQIFHLKFYTKVT